MIGLDTNVLVRFLVEDDPKQRRIATDLLTSMSERGEKGFIADIVLAELSWVLARSYHFSRQEIAGVVRQLLLARQLIFRDQDEIYAALEHYEKAADLADHLIVEQSLASGCAAVATFDKKLQKRIRCLSPLELSD